VAGVVEEAEELVRNSRRTAQHKRGLGIITDIKLRRA